MKKILLIFCCALFALITKAQENPLPIERYQIDSVINRHLEKEKTIFNWDEVDNRFLWSALVHSDSMVSIGFRPATENRIRARIHEIDVNAPQWQAARQRLVNYILDQTSERYGQTFRETDLFPFGIVQKLPFLSVKIFNLEMLEYLRSLPQVRYVHPMNYTLNSEQILQKSTSGCSPTNNSINSSDYTTITPQSRASWHHQFANIDAAWSNSNKGDDIWVAVIDTGVSDENDKLNGDFDEGESSGRSIERKGFYRPSSGAPYDGWEDQCGHGTQMLSLIAAPRGFDNTPAGIAYKCNVVSYRAVEDVVVNTSEEKAGVSEALMDIGDDPRIKIVSMSLGDVFFNGQVADAIIYAHNKGKLIFVAAGTSTFFTGFFVTFPANMDETVAVTGVQDQDINNRRTCNSCHDGSKVDFVKVMERASNTSRTALTLYPDVGNAQGYVGGSSAATASTAGIAALVWGNNPTWDRGQILNKLIQSADYYPNRDGDLGWGKIDANLAVSSGLTAGCTTSFSNEATIEITNISFPAEDDGFGSENEWVITLGNESFYFDVDEDGASGNPANYINLSECGSIPMLIDLGTSACAEQALDLFVASHEDDNAFGNCTLESGDDLSSSETVSVNLANGTFTHTSPAGNFVFTYVIYCTPTATPAASVTGDTTICQNNPDAAITFTAAGGQAPYTISYNINQGATQTVQTTGNTATLNQTTGTLGTFDYTLTKVEDANGCFQNQNDVASVEVIDNCSIKLNIKAMLEGSYTDDSMRSDLNTLNQVPNSDPYGNGASISDPINVLADHGDDTIVDWVEVLLRSETAPFNVVSRQSALVQKDGDVVATDGVSPLSFTNVLPATYYVSIRHRNHLEVTLQTPLLLVAVED